MSFFVEYIVRNSSYKETMFIYMGSFKDRFRTTWLKGIIWISGKISGKRHTSLVNTTGVVVTINEKTLTDCHDPVLFLYNESDQVRL